MADGEAMAVTLRADFKQFERALKQAQNQTDAKLNQIERKFQRSNRVVKDEATGLGKALEGVKSFGGGVAAGLPVIGAGMTGVGVAAGAAAVGVAALVASLRGVQESAAWAATLTDAADRIGVTTEALQELRYIADETGVDLAQLDKSLEALNGTLGAFKTGIGSGRITPIFEALGLTQADLANVNNAQELLPILADRLGQVGDRAAQVQLARKLGIEPLLPLLRSGSEGLERMAKEGRDLGLVLSADVVGGLDETDRALEKNRQQIDANVRSMKATLAPFWVWVTEQAAKASRAISNLFTFTESERLQSAIDLRARIERGQRANGRPLDTRTQGIYDRAGREAQAILDARRRREAEKPVAAPSDDFTLNLGGGGSGGGSRSSRAGNDAEREAQQALARDRRYQDQLSAAQGATLQAQSQLATTVEQRASAAILLLDQDRQERRIQLERQVQDGDLTQAQADRILAAEEGVWIAREANIAAMVDNENIQKARDQLLDALRRDAAANETARQAYEKAKEDFRYDFVDGVRAALDGELGGYFDNLADRFANRLLSNLADDLFDQLKGNGDGANWIASIGKFLGFADGGMVRGAGSGTSDSIPARLSNGEFVVRAAAVQKHRALLEAINRGMLPAFARGGLVATNEAGAPESFYPS